jgi:acetyl esterase
LPTLYWPLRNAFVISCINRCFEMEVYLRARYILQKAKKHTIIATTANNKDNTTTTTTTTSRTTTTTPTTFTIYQFMPNDDGITGGEKLPALLYFHGGAFVYTYVAHHIQQMELYAQQARYAVFMVDYRLGPHHIFPIPFEDAWTSLLWLHTNADTLRVDRNSIVIAGDSAGGCLAASLAQKVKDHQSQPNIIGQMLLYPVLDMHCNTPSALLFDNAPIFNNRTNQEMWQVYLGIPPNTKKKNDNPTINHKEVISTVIVPQYASPNERLDLSGLATAYIENTEYDPLRDEAAVYAHRLKEAGVPTTFHPTKGTIHGYDSLSSIAKNNPIIANAILQRLHFLQSILHTSSSSTPSSSPTTPLTTTTTNK